MADEVSKRIILGRRATFVAAAMAGLNAAMCGGETSGNPQACLSVAVDGGSAQPCLSPIPPDASSADASRADAADAGEPQPCLAPIPPDAGDGG